MPGEVAGLARVTPEQFGVLGEVLDHRALTMSELAHARGIALNTATSLVDRLVTAGLAERGGDDADRRVVRVTLTARGGALVKELRRLRAEIVGGMLDELDDAEVDSILTAIPALARLAGLAPAARR